MKRIIKMAFVLGMFSVLSISAASLTPEWKDFVMCMNENTLTPSVVNAMAKFNGKPVADNTKDNIGKILRIGLPIVLSQVPGIDWNTFSGSQLCTIVKVPDALLNMLPDSLKALIPAVIQGACLKGLSTVTGKCDFPGTLLTENEFLLSEFAKCVSSKVVTSPTVQEKLGAHSFVRVGLDGAITSGLYNILSSNAQSKQPGASMKFSLAALSDQLYKSYLQSLLEGTLRLPADLTDPLKALLDSTLYTYGKTCLEAAKTKTSEALAAKKIQAQPVGASLANLQVGVTATEKAKLEAAPIKVEPNLPEVEEDFA